MAPQAVSLQMYNIIGSLSSIECFFFSHTVIHKLSVTSGEGSPPPTCLLTSWLIYLDQAKAQMCLVKRQLRVNHDFKGNPRPLPNCGNLREEWQQDVPTAHTHHMFPMKFLLGCWAYHCCRCLRASTSDSNACRYAS